jgi:hypothetical protein
MAPPDRRGVLFDPSFATRDPEAPFWGVPTRKTMPVVLVWTAIDVAAGLFVVFFVLGPSGSSPGGRSRGAPPAGVEAQE